MTIKNLFIFDAIVCLLFGLPCMFIPQALAKFFLTDPALTDGAIALSRSYGIILTGGAIGLLSARNSVPSAARRGFLIFIVIAGTLTSINLIHAVLTGIDSTNGWLGIIPTLVVTIWGILLLPKEKVSKV
jgi:hypothetical protein